MSKKEKNQITRQSIEKTLGNLSSKLRKYTYIAYFLLIVATLGFTIFSIGNLANPEPTEDQISDIRLKIISPKIDTVAIGVIEKLREQNIDIDSIFVDRDNPFNE